MTDDRSTLLVPLFFRPCIRSGCLSSIAQIGAPLKGNRVAPAQHITVEPQIGKAGMEPLTCREGEEETLATEDSFADVAKRYLDYQQRKMRAGAINGQEHVRGKASSRSI